jgi:hypothetical protein
MKTKHILTALHFCVGLFFFALPQQSEAQFLNKLTKGLEKVNKGLDKFNKGMDKLNEAARERSGKESTTETELPKETTPTTIDHTQLEKKESNTDDLELAKFFRGNTIHLKSKYWQSMSEPHEGIFSLQETNGLSFYRVTGQKLFNEVWKNCSYSWLKGKEPYFSCGVCPMMSTTPNEKGENVIHLLYSNGTSKPLKSSIKHVSPFKDGIAIAKEYSIKERDFWKEYYINTKGEPLQGYPKISGGDDDAIRPLCDNRRAYLSDEDNQKGWGYIDGNGTVVIPPGKYDEVEDFSEGYAWVVKDNEWLLINTSGRVVVDLDFQKGKYTPTLVKDAVFYVEERAGNYQYYSVTGQKLKEVEYASSFCDGTAYVSFLGQDLKEEENGDLSNGYVQIVDRDFKIVKTMKYDEMQPSDILKIKWGEVNTSTCFSGDKDHIISPGGVFSINSYYSTKTYNSITGFDNFHRDKANSYARINHISLDGKKYKGVMDRSGEIVLMICDEE